MTQNARRDERTPARRLAEIERRLRALETAPRAAKTSFSNGQLTVGDPASSTRIDIDAAESRIRFNSADGATDLTAYGAGGAILRSGSEAGQTFPFATQTLVWDGPYFGSIQASRVDGETATVQSEVYADVQDSGGGNSRGTVSLSARGVGDHNSSVVNLSADGGVILYTNSRTTDPPAPPVDCVTLYVKSNRLYYKDAANAVHGPL